MKLAVMQPYLFPYLGYFQLMRAVDRFVIYDDVTFIKQGWINGNRTLHRGSARRFSVPVEHGSSHVLISETRIHGERFLHWRRKFLHTLAQDYAGAPEVRPVTALVERVLGQDTLSVGELARRSLTGVTTYLGLDPVPANSSAVYQNRHLSGEERILDICDRERADTYVNLPGGRSLYHPGAFASRGVALRFLKPTLDPYPQGGPAFVPGLSIIDVLMRHDPATVRRMVEAGRLEEEEEKAAP